MPQLGETVVEGTLTKWFKGVGDAVEKGEILFEISTDKVDTEIPAPASGTLSAILVEAGSTVDVGTTLAIIDSPTDAPPTGTDELVPASTPRPLSGVPGTQSADTHSRRLSPAVRRLLDEHKLRPEEIPASGAGGRLTRDDVLSFLATTAEVAGSSPTSPLVRRLIDDHHLDSDSIPATGRDGRLARRDVEAAIQQREELSASDEVVPFSRTRQLTAEHMTRSKATSAHTLMVKEVDFERVEAQRRRYGAGFAEREGFTLTYLPFVAAAVLDALRAFPHLNASVGDNALIVHRRINLGIAVDLDGDGLVVPVIHDADRYDVVSLARRIRELATSARTKRLVLDDTSGGTFTITNPGPFGTLMTGAIINQPQVAILALDGVSRKPVVITSAWGEESLAIHSVGLLALTFDHRAVDGATAAKFLAHVSATLNGSDLLAAP